MGKVRANPFAGGTPSDRLPRPGPAAQHRALPTRVPGPQADLPHVRRSPDAFGGHVPAEQWRGPNLEPRPAAESRPSVDGAFAKKAFAPLAPEAVFTPPAALVDALERAERVMVVSHVPPDVDCESTALGTMYALKKLGKEACAVVDAEIPRSMAGVDLHGDLRRADDVADFDPDLVLLVDVAEASRIGGAARYLERAPAVAIVDHHRVDPSPAAVGVAPGTPIAAWIDEHADSASLMAAGLVNTLAARRGASTDGWDEVRSLYAAGAATDTGWFEMPNARADSLRVFKHLLDADPRRLAALRDRLDFELPRAAQHLLNRSVRFAVRADHGHSAVWMSADRRILTEALRLAQTADAAVRPDDVSGALMNRLDRESADHGLAVLLQEEDSGRVRLSIRSHHPEAAGELARALGGGGKHGAGGAVLDTTLVDARRRVRSALDRVLVAQTARLRLMGSV